MKSFLRQPFPVIDTFDRVLMFFNYLILLFNAGSVVVQLHDFVVEVGNGNTGPALLALGFVFLNTFCALFMKRVERKRRQVALDHLAEEAAEQEQMLADQERQEQERLKQERQQAAEQAAQQELEKVEQQLTRVASEQATLPEIFAGRRQRRSS